MLIHKGSSTYGVLRGPRRVLAGLILFGIAAGTSCTPVSQTSSAPSDKGPASTNQQKVETVRVLETKPAARWRVLPDPVPLDADRIATHFEQFIEAGRQLQQPGVLVLPITDSEGRVRPDGLGLCYQAMLALERSTNASQIAMDADTAFATLQDSGCGRIGSTFTERFRNACTRSVGAQLSVTGALANKNSAWELTVALHPLDGATELTKHSIGRGQLNTIPGLIASEISRHLKITLSAEQRLRMLKPQVTSDEASTQLIELMKTPPAYYADWIQFDSFLQQNPDCVGAWQHLIRGSDELYFDWYYDWIQWSLHCLGRINPGLEDSHLELALITRKARLLTAEHYYLDLERVASKLPGNFRIPSLMLSCALKSGDAKAFDKMLAAWRKSDQRYVDYLLRGRFLINAVQNHSILRILGTNWTPDQVRQRLEEARSDLQKAIELHPDGWQAHSLLMSLATALKSPREEMEQHFAAIDAVLPGYRTAYRCKLEFLSPYHHGTIEDVATFAEQCVRTKRWDEGIPQLFVEAVRFATTDQQTSATSFAAYRNERLWQAAQVYRQEAEKSATADDQRFAFNYFVYLAGVSGHAKDVASEFNLIQHDNDQQIYQRAIFETPITFQFLHDLASAPVETDAKNVNLALRLAMGAGELDLADKLLQQPAPADQAVMILNHRNATALGQRLTSEREVSLQPKEIISAFLAQGAPSDGMFPGSNVSVSGMTVNGDSLVWRCKSVSAGCALNLLLPVGIRHGVISGEVQVTGTVERFGVLLHTRALRDIVTVMYKPKDRYVSISRSRHEIAKFPWDAQNISFRFEFGAKEDILEPLPGCRVTTPVLDDVPSGFAFEADDERQGQNTGTLILRNMKIQVLD